MPEAHALLDLRRELNWDPARLTAEAFRWPRSEHLVPLRELATRLAPRSFAEAGAPVITPQSVDGASGAVRRRSRKYQGSVFQVGAELRNGDVLMPRLRSGPPLLVSDRLTGALVSARYAALRPVERELGLWLWALLGSESGIRLRTSLSRGDAVTHIDAVSLLEAAVPVPPLAVRRNLLDQLVELERTTHTEEEEPSETWWHTTDLREVPWRIALATPDRSPLEDGTPLEMLCGQISRGRETRRHALTEPAPDYLPVADVSVLGGKAPRRWMPVADTGPSVIAHPGDLMVAGLGNYAYATVVEHESIADQHVFVLRLRDVTSGKAIAAYLNSQRGYRVRQMLLTGSTIPSLRAADLAALPIPDDALRSPVEHEAPPLPLARRLENVLWGN